MKKLLLSVVMATTLITSAINVSASYSSTEPKTEEEIIAASNKEHTEKVISAYKKRLEKRKQEAAEAAYLVELEAMKTSFHWKGSKLTPIKGVNKDSPSGGTETYYNQILKGIWTWFGDLLEALGFYYEDIRIREDGVRVIKNRLDGQWYVCCAANLNVHPRGSIVNTSLGKAVVLDYNGHCDLPEGTPYDIDINANWGPVIPN